MKIVCLSDTHNLHDYVDLPEGDLLVHAGDLTLEGKGYEMENVAAWLCKTSYKHKVIIAGNHDWLFQNRPDVARKVIGHGQNGVVYLQDEAVIIDGVKFYGTPWQPRFFDWAFNVDRGASIRKYWDLIPADTDVLITHGPPYGIRDMASSRSKHVGCEELYAAVTRIKPKLHVFGHIHGGHGVTKSSDTMFLNAAIVNEAYAVTHKPYVFNYDERQLEIDGAASTAPGLSACPASRQGRSQLE